MSTADRTAQDLIDQWRLHPDPEVGSCANQLAGWLMKQIALTVDVHEYTKGPKHCHACALAAWAKEWKRSGMLQAELDRLRFPRQDATAAFQQLFERWLKEDVNPAALYKVERICSEAFTTGWEAASRGGGDTRPPGREAAMNETDRIVDNLTLVARASRGEGVVVAKHAIARYCEEAAAALAAQAATIAQLEAK
jgi:hypothetical protein